MLEYFKPSYISHIKCKSVSNDKKNNLLKLTLNEATYYCNSEVADLMNNRYNPISKFIKISETLSLTLTCKLRLERLLERRG